MTVTEFLEARIAEDEARASYYGPLAMGTARVLDDCAAKRAIIKSLNSTAAAHATESHLGQKFVLAGMGTGFRLALQMLTLPYREHPDFNEDWARG